MPVAAGAGQQGTAIRPLLLFRCCLLAAALFGLKLIGPSRDPKRMWIPKRSRADPLLLRRDRCRGERALLRHQLEPLAICCGTPLRGEFGPALI
ncbi:MAG: hypothetical protein GW900_10040, partial [Gammaproteobacteria bacterium]|nr:hypothetical protein [Gammaproteobacteria bacterium]